MGLSTQLSKAKSPIIAFSGGKDSLLVLDMVHEIDPSVPVLIFQDWFNPAHKKWAQSVIRDRNLTAFFYRPTVVKYVKGSIVSHYPFLDSSIPVISDVVHDDKCGLDWGQKVLNKTPLASFLWDLVFTGSRKSDSHPLVPELDFTGLNVCCPIWELTDEQVWEEIKSRNIQTSQTDSDAHLCTRCLETDRIVFCPKLQRNIQSIN
jgi:hypothetical protein